MIYNYLAAAVMAFWICIFAANTEIIFSQRDTSRRKIITKWVDWFGVACIAISLTFLLHCFNKYIL